MHRPPRLGTSWRQMNITCGKAVRAAHGDDVLFARIGLKQPDKAAALAGHREKAARRPNRFRRAARFTDRCGLQNATRARA